MKVTNPNLFIASEYLKIVAFITEETVDLF